MIKPIDDPRRNWHNFCHICGCLCEHDICTKHATQVENRVYMAGKQRLHDAVKAKLVSGIAELAADKSRQTPNARR